MWERVESKKWRGENEHLGEEKKGRHIREGLIVYQEVYEIFLVRCPVS